MKISIVKYTKPRKEEPAIKAEAYERPRLHLPRINKWELIQLLKRRIANSLNYRKSMNSSNEYHGISNINYCPNIYKRRSHSHIFQDSAKWEHNILIRKCDYPNSKLEIVFRKGSVCKGRPIISSQFYQRNGSNHHCIKPNKALSRILNKNMHSFDETIKNSDKSRNEEYEHRANITEIFKCKPKLPKIMPSKKYRMVKFKKNSSFANGCEQTNSGWNLERENIEFSNETLAIQ